MLRGIWHPRHLPYLPCHRYATGQLVSLGNERVICSGGSKMLSSVGFVLWRLGRWVVSWCSTRRPCARSHVVSAENSARSAATTNWSTKSSTESKWRSTNANSNSRCGGGIVLPIGRSWRGCWKSTQVSQPPRQSTCISNVKLYHLGLMSSSSKRSYYNHILAFKLIVNINCTNTSSE